MQIDTTDAMTMFETLGSAVKEAGIGKYNGFLLVEALRAKGWRLKLEQMPIEVCDNPKADHLLSVVAAD